MAGPGAILLIAVIILQVFSPAVGHPQEAVFQNADCIGDYVSLEKVVLNKTSNVYNLQEAFFPTNRQMSVVVDVQYCFPKANASNNSDYTNKLAQEYKVMELKDGTWSNATCLKFRWMESPINLYIRPKLLMYLSLFTYHVDVRSTSIYIEKQFCTALEDTAAQVLNPPINNNNLYSVCNTTELHRDLLNNLTTNVSSIL